MKGVMDLEIAGMVRDGEERHTRKRGDCTKRKRDSSKSLDVL